MNSLGFLQAVDELMQVENNMGSITYKDSRPDIFQALLENISSQIYPKGNKIYFNFQIVQFLEERGYMDLAKSYCISIAFYCEKLWEGVYRGRQQMQCIVAQPL